MKLIVGFIHRVVYASLISLLGVTVCVLSTMDVGTLPCKLMNWPVSIVGQHLPGWAGLNVFNEQNRCDFCTPTERFQSHMTLAIPLYVILFYLPNVVAWLWWRRRRSKRETLLVR